MARRNCAPGFVMGAQVTARDQGAQLEQIVSRHLHYEFWMLKETLVRLERPQPDVVVANALIESFCIHARQLIDFFNNDQAVWASEFTGGSYEAVAVQSVPKALRIKLNTQIAHLTLLRTADDSLKIGRDDRKTLATAICAEFVNFETKLEPKYLALWKAGALLPTQTPGATNQIAAISTSPSTSSASAVQLTITGKPPAEPVPDE